MKQLNLSADHNEKSRNSNSIEKYLKSTSQKAHGGELSRGKRKTVRPFHSRKPLHIVLKSSKAIGRFSLRTLQNKSTIDRIIHTCAKRAHVKIHQYSINSNHVHLLIHAKHRRDFQKFLRVLTGWIAKFVLKGEVVGVRFWDALAFSRVTEWGKAFERAKAYVIQNILEAEGLIPYQPRRRKKKRSFAVRNQIGAMVRERSVSEGFEAQI